MKNKLFILLIFVQILFGYESLDLGKVNSSINTSSYLYCTKDENNTLDFNSILQNKNLEKITKSNTGYSTSNYWCRLNVHNSSKEKKDFVFSNPRPGVDYIDVQIHQNNLKQNYSLGDMVSLENRSFSSVFSNFKLSLNPNETATIISQYKTIGNFELSWDIASFSDFLKFENLNFILIFGFFGFLLAMMFYKFFIYLYIKERIYLIYAAMMLTLIISQASVQGSMHYFFYDSLNLTFITLCSWIFSHIFLVTLWLFTFDFFQINKKDKLYYPFLIVIIYNVLVVVYYTLGFFDATLLQITPIMVLIAFIESIFLLFVSFAMFYKKKPGSGYFLVAHILYIVAILNYLLTLRGEFEFTLFGRHSTAMGLFFMISFMSLALSARFKKLKDENISIQNELEKNKQFTLIGTTISYVAHQWKQPLSILASNSTNLLAKIEHKPNLPILDIKPNIEALENNILQINETLNSIKGLFLTPDIKDKEFSFEKAIDEIISNYSQELEKNNITIQKNIVSNCLIFGNKNLLIHAIGNIIQNSIEAFNNKNEKRYISINCDIEKTQIILTILDNAGGIKIFPIEKIFETLTTSKNFGMGIGLTFTKNILESKFNGNIKVSNTQDGTKFTITL